MDTTATTGSDDMSDESNDRHDERGATQRMTVPEAARLLGISEGAIRKRVERGKLDAEHTPGGRLIVYLDHDATATTDTTRDSHDRHEPKPIEPERYIGSLEDQVQDLRRRLDQETEANRENRRIIAGLTQRIPEIEAAPREHEDPGPSPTPTDTTGAPETYTRRRPWWRRVFGG